MTFRRRIVVLAASAVAAAIALASVITFVVVRHDLRADVDASLRGLRPKVVFVSRTSAAPAHPSPLELPIGGSSRLTSKTSRTTTPNAAARAATTAVAATPAQKRP